ncbi:MAG: hypothetical protein AB4050_12655 [Synechococcus sp.]
MGRIAASNSDRAWIGHPYLEGVTVQRNGSLRARPFEGVTI